MRIASLLPSATEIVCALGLEQDLVAITHECDYPPSVLAKPAVTSSVLTPGSSGADIDRHIRRLVHQGSSIYRLDADRLAALQPDLILTQELCEVCAVSYPIVEQAARRLKSTTELVSLEPQSLEDVFGNIKLVGELTDRAEAAQALIERLSARVARVREQLGEAESRRVLCLEWLDPPFNCGHWTPQLVEIAGGEALFGAPGRPASALTWEQLAAAHPEVVVVMACGFSLARSLKEAESIRHRLTAPELYVVDGNAFFSRPGPRLVDSVEIMAGILHPEAVTPPGPEVARRIA